VDVPSESVKHHTHEIIHPSDRYGQQIVNRYTSLRVNQALSSYIASAGQARTVTKHALREMCTALLRESLTIVQASHVALLLQVAVLHATASRQKGWVLPVVENTTVSAQRVALTLHGMRPYWMDGAGSRAVSNDVEMNGIFLLTAPNMSGKSTLMRSILVTALLANCGLFVPCLRASVPRYDSFFLRTASHDTPLEGKSAFAVEMDDIRVMMRDSTQKSLVMIDEIGKGTSSRDGAAFAGALLEWMSSTGMHGIFATHLHELLHMKLNLDNVKMKRMGVTLTAPDPAWTYCLEDGSCTNSMAFITARAFGITSSLIDRALEIQRAFDHESNMTGILEATKSIANSVSGEGDHDNKYSVERVSRVLREEVVNDESLGSLLHSSSISVVRDGHFTSPLSEGRSAVYVLIKRECKHASDWDWNQSMRNGKPCPNCSCA
ncbi:MSH1, partial [Symbiodinium microadriaticum]